MAGKPNDLTVTLVLSQKQAAALTVAMNHDRHRCERWLSARHVSPAERVNCHELLDRYKEIRMMMEGSRT